MLALAFDTSTPMVSVAVLKSDVQSRDTALLRASSRDWSAVTLAKLQVEARNAQGETLVPLVAEAMRTAGVRLGDVGVIGVGLGPGPFTGLRVGVVTAAGLADALGVPAYGMCSLDAVAGSHTSLTEPFAVATDARRKQVYWATYDETGARTAGPELAPPADLAAMLAGRVRVVVGAGALLHAEAFAGFEVRSENPSPSAVCIAQHAVAEALQGNESGSLEPLYLRRPDARPPGAPKRVTTP